ncbi:unnamed protein product [Trichobilharzia regenti]|nr:unnamed protein product [Trichobilharzia regenti]
MDVHNLTCSQDVVLNDYFDLVTKSKDQKIIGVIGESISLLDDESVCFTLLRKWNRKCACIQSQSH